MENLNLLDNQHEDLSTRLSNYLILLELYQKERTTLFREWTINYNELNDKLNDSQDKYFIFLKKLKKNEWNWEDKWGDNWPRG